MSARALFASTVLLALAGSALAVNAPDTGFGVVVVVCVDMGSIYLSPDPECVFSTMLTGPGHQGGYLYKGLVGWMHFCGNTSGHGNAARFGPTGVMFFDSRWGLTEKEAHDCLRDVRLGASCTNTSPQVLQEVLTVGGDPTHGVSPCNTAVHTRARVVKGSGGLTFDDNDVCRPHAGTARSCVTS